MADDPPVSANWNPRVDRQSQLSSNWDPMQPERDRLTEAREMRSESAEPMNFARKLNNLQAPLRFVLDEMLEALLDVFDRGNAVQDA
jgi:hypothetical protein